jgi:hexosaminidase
LRGTNEGQEAWSINQSCKSGYNTILSNGFYIDLMLGLESHYLNDPCLKDHSYPEEKQGF